jgi:PASTA domain
MQGTTASVFAITVAATTVRLDADGRGAASFAVSNTSNRALRGRARVAAVDPQAQPWLTLVGDAERDFAIGATQQYTVQVAVPAGAPAGTYAFRLDEVGVDNPDEEYAQGPTVAFEVVPRPPPPPPAAPRVPWWIIVAAVVAVLVLAAIVAFVLVRRVPDVRGKTEPDAKVALESADLVEGTVTRRFGAPVGVVASEDPDANAFVRRGTAVDLVVNRPRIAADFEGRWVNDNPASAIRGIDISASGQTLTIRPAVSCPTLPCRVGGVDVPFGGEPVLARFLVDAVAAQATVTMTLSLSQDGTRLSAQSTSNQASVLGSATDVFHLAGGG